jgi:inositol 1,4,5-triphosphate receptor type 1
MCHGADVCSVSPLSVGSLYYVFVLGLSVLGLFYNGYFYCFHLFHIVVGNDTLNRAIQVWLCD